MAGWPPYTSTISCAAASLPRASAALYSTTPFRVTPIAPSDTHPGAVATVGAIGSVKLTLFAVGLPGLPSIAVSAAYCVIGQLPIFASTGRLLARMERLPDASVTVIVPGVTVPARAGRNGLRNRFQEPLASSIHVILDRTLPGALGLAPAQENNFPIAGPVVLRCVSPSRSRVQSGPA